MFYLALKLNKCPGSATCSISISVLGPILHRGHSTTRPSAGNAPYSARLLFLLLIPAFITKNLHSALDQTVSLIHNSLVHHFLDINAGLKLVFSIRSDNILCAKKLWKYLMVD